VISAWRENLVVSEEDVSLLYLAADADEALRYTDPDIEVPADPNEIDAAAMDRVVRALNALRMNDTDRLGDWFARFTTLYRAAGEVSPPDAIPSRIEIEWDLGQGARLLRHPWSRAVWRRAGKGARLFVSGLDFTVSVRDAQRLAAAQAIDETIYAALSQAGRDAVFALLEAGHYRMLVDEDE
jgi:50S ribosomal protein L16 3-hydroxylase